jgi:hypothetical protein
LVLLLLTGARLSCCTISGFALPPPPPLRTMLANTRATSHACSTTPLGSMTYAGNMENCFNNGVKKTVPPLIHHNGCVLRSNKTDKQNLTFRVMSVRTAAAFLK